MLIGSATSRRALLRQLWAMVQTRAEAASLVVSLQKTAVIQGVALYAVAALAASACVTALILFVAVATPPEYRALALGLVVLTLLGTALFAATRASRQIRRDTALIADFWKGLRLDLAMINLALKDPDPDDDEELAERERAKAAVREAAIEKARTPSTAEDGAVTPTGPSVAAASAAMSAASTITVPPPAKAPGVTRGREEALRDEAVARTAMHDGPVETSAGVDAIPEAATEREMPAPPVTPVEAMTPRATREPSTHGSA